MNLLSFTNYAVMFAPFIPASTIEASGHAFTLPPRCIKLKKKSASNERTEALCYYIRKSVVRWHI